MVIPFPAFAEAVFRSRTPRQAFPSSVDQMIYRKNAGITENVENPW